MRPPDSPEPQESSSSLDQKEPESEPPQRYEEKKELCSKQEEEALSGEKTYSDKSVEKVNTVWWVLCEKGNMLSDVIFVKD